MTEGITNMTSNLVGWYVSQGALSSAKPKDLQAARLRNVVKPDGKGSGLNV